MNKRKKAAVQKYLFFSLFLFLYIQSFFLGIRVMFSVVGWLNELIFIRWWSKSFRTGRLEREPQMVQLSAIICSCIAILWVSLVSFVAITLCVGSQRVLFSFISLWLSPETFGYTLVYVLYSIMREQLLTHSTLPSVWIQCKHENIWLCNTVRVD
jgi:hypothetical protein